MLAQIAQGYFIQGEFSKVKVLTVGYSGNSLLVTCGLPAGFQNIIIITTQAF